jgi:hypothetical protein
MAKTGKTTGNLKMRSGPGMEFEPPIAFLVPDTELEILGEQGDWWKVRHGGKEGYVGKKYVAVSDSPAAAAPAKDAPSTAGISAASISLSGGKEPSSSGGKGLGADVAALAKDSGRDTGSTGSISTQPGGREAGERGHSGVDEK